MKNQQIRSVRMTSKTSKLDLAKVIEEMPENGFTFKQLAEAVSSDYESLKSAVFNLLLDEPPVLKQVFDSEKRQMLLIRSNL